jgi:centractin
VYDGFAIPNSIRRIDVAGRDVTEYLQIQLRKAGYIFHTSAEKDIVRQIKEKTSYVAVDPNKEEKDWSGGSLRTEAKHIDYSLPDGKVIRVRTALRRSKFMVVTIQNLTAMTKNSTLESGRRYR